MLVNTETRYIVLLILKDGQHIAIPNTFELYSQACFYRSAVLHGKVELKHGDKDITPADILQVNVIWEQVNRVEIMNGTPPTQEIGF